MAYGASVWGQGVSTYYKKQGTQKSDGRTMVYEEWEIAKISGNTYSKTRNKIIKRMKNLSNRLIRVSTNYDEHGNHMTKRPRAALLENEEGMN